MQFHSFYADFNAKRQEGDDQLTRRPKLKSIITVLSIISARSPGNPQLFRMYVPDELSSLLGSMCCIAFWLDGLVNDRGLNKWLQTILKTCTPGKVIKRKLTLMQGLYNRDQESHQVSRPTKEFVCMKSLTEWHAGKQKISQVNLNVFMLAFHSYSGARKQQWEAGKLSLQSNLLHFSWLIVILQEL